MSVLVTNDINNDYEFDGFIKCKVNIFCFYSAAFLDNSKYTINISVQSLFIIMTKWPFQNGAFLFEVGTIKVTNKTLIADKPTGIGLDLATHVGKVGINRLD